MTYRGFVIIFASFLLFLGQCGYSNGDDCESPKCDVSGLGTNSSTFLRTSSAADQEGCYNDESEVTLSCTYGILTVESPPDNTCNDGTWNDTRMAVCTGFCTFTSGDDNLMLDRKQPGYNVNDTLAFSCEDGYKLTSNSPRSFRCLTSLNGGSWNKTDNLEPACEAFSCSNPNITEGNITWTPKANETTYDGHQTIKYSCPDGVTLDGKDTNTCVDQDKWEFDHPTCMSSGNVIQAFWYLLTVTTSYTLLSFYM